MGSEKWEGKISPKLHCDQNFLPVISKDRISCRLRILLYHIYLSAKHEPEELL